MIFSCEDCRHWRQLPIVNEAEENVGECTRYAPSRPMADGSNYKWPTTEADQSCGEIEPNDPLAARKAKPK